MSLLRQLLYAVCVLSAASVSLCAKEEPEDEETNPFYEAAKSLIQDQLQNPNSQAFGAVGGMLSSFIQSGGGKQLGDLFAGGSKNNPAADIIAGIGSLVASAAAQGPDRQVPGNQQSGGGWDPQLIGSMVSIFANSMTQDNNVDVNNNEVDTGGAKNKKQGGIDLESIISMAGSFMNQNQKTGGAGAGGGGMESLLNLLPVLMQGMAGDDQNNLDNNVLPNKQKPSAMPPFLEHFGEYWTHFQNSEFGRTLWKNSGLDEIVKLFTDVNGHFDVDKIFKSLENPSFRRRWIKSLTSFVAEWVSHVADPATQARYLGTAQFVANSFLKTQGYSKAVLFDPARPGESLSKLADAVFKKQFGLQVQSSTYIRPAVIYMQDVFKIGQSKGLSFSHLTPAEIEGKLADTLNGEVIEPVLKVWRAYRFARENKKCDRYVVCIVNQVKDVGVGLKPGVTKLASLGASWFLSGQTGTPFWKLYNAATENFNCDQKYASPGCNDYHEYDIQTTTEYVHNEL